MGLSELVPEQGMLQTRIVPCPIATTLALTWLYVANATAARRIESSSSIVASCAPDVLTSAVSNGSQLFHPST